MSSEPAIRVEGLGKEYRIGGRQEMERGVREVLAEILTSPLRKASRLLRGDASGAANLSERFWALRDLSFSVQPGEVLGIIGRNGAGKSTLLKLLSRITDPSEGRAEIRGRVGSLLEVGTGFHPELTGRENTYLNGAILGMGRREIDAKFDGIVEFAELDRFIDTPVKHYSSGMYTRLAFSVAAHLEPEILLIDEVLAVGDASFQRKCLNKMSGVAREGRTVLFVSHNMAAVQSLCPRTLVLAGGRCIFDGATEEAMEHYLNRPGKTGSAIDLAPYRGFHLRPVLRSVTLLDRDGRQTSTFPSGEPIVMEFELASEEPVSSPEITLGINNVLGTRVFTVKPRWQNQNLEGFRGGVRIRCTLEEPRLLPGLYSMKVVLDEHYGTVDVIDDAPAFEIESRDYWGSGQLPTPISQGVVLQNARWSLVPSEEPPRKAPAAAMGGIHPSEIET